MENFGMLIVSGLGTFVQLFVLGICIFYVSKKSDIEAWFLLIASFTSLLLRAFYMILVPVLFKYEIISHNVWSMLSPFLGIIGVLADIMFAVGLLMLVNKVLSK